MRRTKIRSSWFGLVLVLVAALWLVSLPVSAEDEPLFTVQDLAWMTGHWAGALGPNTLEEQWSQPAGGSIAALVRMRTEDTTGMIELIVVEEVNGGLMLRLQQWNPGFKPRTEGPQTFALKEMGERSVTWEAIDEGGMSELKYSSPTEDKFIISIVNAAGGAFDIELDAVN